MKSKFMRHTARFSVGFLTSALLFSGISLNLHAVNMITKTQSNTSLGVAQIKAPTAPDTKDTSWAGSYVYYGNYEGNPIRFRVLAPETNRYGSNTMLLDSDSVLFDYNFDAYGNNVWENSSLRTYLNNTFFQNSFTNVEQSSIAKSTYSGNAGYDIGSIQENIYYNDIGLNGDNVFLLDAADVVNDNYGYSAYTGWMTYTGYWDHWLIDYDYYNVDNRIKSEGDCWWLRTQSYDSPYGMSGMINSEGILDYEGTVAAYGVAPVINISMDSILFSTIISGNQGMDNAEYKLTLVDNNLKITIPSGYGVGIDGTTISVTYDVTGSHSEDVNSVSVIILDKEYTSGNSNGANILYYSTLIGSYNTNGCGTFSIPSTLSMADWGKNYHVYIIAEDINDSYSSDYASVPFEINLGKTIIFKNEDGTVLQKRNVPINEIPVFFGKTPTKPSDSCYNYTFSNWKPSIEKVVEDKEYCVEYIKTAIPTPIPTPEYNVGSFINRCYEVALGRSADASGYNYWVENLNNGQACGAQVGYGFIFSSEYMNRNRSNEDFVKDMYSMYFGRSADAAGFSYWVEQLEAGVDREEIMAGFANSQEFYNLCDKYNVVCGTYVVGVPNDMQGGVNCFVARLYKVCLNRLPDMAGQSGWVINLLNEEATGSSAAYGFVFSQEFINLNLNNTEFVQYMYQAFFGREADSVGLEYWAGQLNSSKASREDVFDGFSKSQEFINLCDSYGIQANVIPTPTATPTAAPKVVEDYYVTKYTFDSNGESGTFFINSFVEYSADYVNSLEVGDSIDNGGRITKIKPLYSGTGIDVETTNGYFYFQLQENGKYYMFDDTGSAITNSIGDTKFTIADDVEIVDGVSIYGEYGIDRTSPYFVCFDGIDAYIDRLDDSDVWYAPEMVIRVIDGEVTLMVLEHRQPWHN